MTPKKRIDGAIMSETRLKTLILAYGQARADEEAAFAADLEEEEEGKALLEQRRLIDLMNIEVHRLYQLDKLYGEETP